jgi:mRNA-degrading endonuclease RelE of RelBE toxin-antitoxin system
MEIIVTEAFEKYYQKLPSNIQQKADKQTEFFKKDIFYPSLHTEKLEPRNKEVWSFRVDKKYRIFFRFNNRDSIRLLVIGPHDWIYKLKF